MDNTLKFVSPFVIAKEMPEAIPVVFTTREHNGKVWGWQDSDSEFATEVVVGGEKKTVEFFVYLTDEDGQDKIWTRSSKNFWTRLQELNLVAGEKVSIIKLGSGKDARYSLSRVK